MVAPASSDDGRNTSRTVKLSAWQIDHTGARLSWVNRVVAFPARNFYLAGRNLVSDQDVWLILFPARNFYRAGCNFIPDPSNWTFRLTTWHGTGDSPVPSTSYQSDIAIDLPAWRFNCQSQTD